MSADASSASDWLKQILSQIDLGSDASLGRSFWARFPNVMHFAGKPVVSSRNVGCFLRLEFERLLPIFVDASSLFFFAKSSPKFHISKEERFAIKIRWITYWSCLYYYPYFVTGKHKLLTLLSNRVYELKLPTPQSSQYASAPLLSAYYPCRTHSLIYDNTPSHNSPICVPPRPPPRPRSETSASNPARERLLLTSFMGYFHLMITSAGCLATNGCLMAIPDVQYSKLTPI